MKHAWPRWLALIALLALLMLRLPDIGFTLRHNEAAWRLNQSWRSAYGPVTPSLEMRFDALYAQRPQHQPTRRLTGFVKAYAEPSATDSPLHRVEPGGYIYFERAALYERTGAWDEMLHWATIGHAHEPRHGAYLYFQAVYAEETTGRDVTALYWDAIGETLFSYSELAPDAYFRLAEAAWRAEDWDGVTFLNSLVIQRNPTHYRALMRLGNLRWEQEQDGVGATSLWLRAVAAEPDATWAYQSLAMHALATGDNAAAVDWLDEILARAPQNEWAVSQRARLNNES